MSRIAKLPPFWKHEPAVWFFQVEAAFGIARISTDETKYQYLLANLDPTVLPFVTDIIRNPPAEGKYEAIKTRILVAFSKSAESKLRKLLKGELLGEQKPTHYLQHMRNLSSGQCDDTLLKSMFLEQLPQQVSAILSASSETDLNKLAMLADKIMDLQRPAHVNAVSNSLEDFQQELLKRVEALSARFDKFTGGNSQRSRSQQRGRSRSKSNNNSNKGNNNNSNDDSKMCYYHRRFGTEARKCNRPCAWVSRDSDSGN